MKNMMEIYGFPSQAFWRSFEIDLLQELHFERPILEVGCSNGAFTRQACGFVETAIDINPKSLRLAERSGVFGEVRLQDASTLNAEDGFRTILMNSVIEHIPNPARVLESSFRALQPGGKVVLTIPLVDMNAHLLFQSKRWIEFRRRRLAHVNLFPLKQWVALLEAAGFRVEQARRYLSPAQIKLWDIMDAFAMIGTARLNLGGIGYKLGEYAPAFLKRPVHKLIARALRPSLIMQGERDGCAALFVATKDAA
jgi:SAM-dependent methyltransferase